eukprot:gnl/TRDRNA2_/TRDRNA2_177765_c3_seq21.p1 gnl/TRDRNA2_/TRDRNA2_177765_c3~~gnl/TRDRNA2_/TRDRNA2_177765_c3_seq21.p1  ORF type:complete len:357 (+),score=54.87 gnl/TRDRNA2_/TRDRNA2_177765_c3_seq21:127-1071(+)
MARNILGVPTLISNVRYFAIELKKMYVRGFIVYAKSAWNIIGLFSYVLLLYSIIYEFAAGHTGTTEGFAAIGTLFAWTSTLYYLRGFRGTGALVSMILAIMKDMKYFMLITCIMTCAYIQVYFILATPIVEEGETSELVWVLYNAAWLGNVNVRDYAVSLLERFMYAAMTLFMLVVLLNLLIAIMGDTFGRVQESAVVEFYFNFAELIYELETLMTPAEQADETRFPAYMIYSQPQKASITAYQGGEDAEISSKEGAQGTGPRIEAKLERLRRGQQTVEGKVDSLQAQVDRIVEQLDATRSKQSTLATGAEYEV